MLAKKILFNTYNIVMRVTFQGVYNAYTPVKGVNSRAGMFVIPSNKPSWDVFIKNNPTEVSFGRLLTRFPFAKLANIPCPYCGIKMITEADFEKYLTDEALSGTSRMALKAIGRFEESMQEPEKRIFQTLQELSEKKPLSNLQELLMGIMPESLKRLQLRQLDILKKLSLISKKLEPPFGEELNKIIKKQKQIINSPDNNIRFKRKNLINAIYNLQLSIPDEKIAKDIEELTHTLPNSMNHYDSFVVKYAERSPLEIGRRIVRPSTGTFEHLLPHSKGGTVELKNGLCVCGKCNNSRGNMPFEDLIDLRPEIKNNIGKHLQLINSIIKKHNMITLDGYIQEVTNTIKELSGGRVDFTKSFIAKK